MKKTLFSMLAIAIALVSCQEEDIPTVPQSEIVINLSTPAPPAAASKLTKAPEISRYIIEVYKADDLTNTIERVEQASGTFRLPLANNTSYTCLFWADDTAPDDNANGTFNALDLKNVTLNSGKNMEDAFFARLDIVNDETTFNIVLKRPTAQVNLIETDLIAEASNIVITHNHYNSFNSLTSDVVGTPVSKDITFTPTVTSGKLGTYLTFAPVTGHMKDFTTVYNSTVNNSIPNVPLKANFITNISGKYAGGSEGFTFIVEIDDVWEEEGRIDGVAVNMGTAEAPNWIKVADRNAEQNGVNGATTGNTAVDYGTYFEWSNVNNNSTNEDMAYRACYNFGAGGGTWRLPTAIEFEKLSGGTSQGIALGNSNRKLKMGTDGLWRLYDERAGEETNYVYFPMSGRIIDGTTERLGERGYYWSNVGEEISARALFFTNNASNAPANNTLTNSLKYSVRCVQDL